MLRKRYRTARSENQESLTPTQYGLQTGGRKPRLEDLVD